MQSCTLAQTLDSLVRVSRRVGYNLSLNAVVFNRENRTPDKPARKPCNQTCISGPVPHSLNTPVHTAARQTAHHTSRMSNGSATQSNSLPRHGAENNCKNHRAHDASGGTRARKRNERATVKQQSNRFHPLHSQVFQALLTLFPKFFSPFPHGTCMLSVSRWCLASDGIYHPISAPIPRNVTQKEYAVRPHYQCRTRLSLSAMPCFKEHAVARGLAYSGQNTIRIQRPNFHIELFLVQSPLLKES